MKYTIHILFNLLIAISSTSWSGSLINGNFIKNDVNKEGALKVGEELEYSVHYLFFNIGSIRFKVVSKDIRNDRTIYKAYAFIDSNPSLSWLVNLHVKFYSEIDQNPYSYGWRSEDSSEKKIYYINMKFDYDNKKMFYEWGEKLLGASYKTRGKTVISIKNECQDGLSLFYYARENALSNKKTKVLTYIDTNGVNTNINFGIEYTKEKIDAVDYPISVVKLDGFADFVGIFGLTGYFEGYFTNDEAKIPIKAKLKVILGSIRVELKKWVRENWAPPKAL